MTACHNLCYAEQNKLILLTTTDETSHNQSIHTYNKYIIHTYPQAHTYEIQPSGQIHLDTTELAFTKTRDALIPLGDINTYTQGYGLYDPAPEHPPTRHMDHDTCQALLTTYHSTTRKQTMHKYACTRSSGSMIARSNDSDSTCNDDADANTMHIQSYSDGSVYKFENSQTCAGFAVTTT